MTRIIAGEYGGRLLRTPAGARTRPTSDRTREALFASLEATHDLDAGPFADLYAGSGAVGLEAVSRGAPAAILVEQNAAAATVIRANIATLGAAARVIVRAVERCCDDGPLNAATVFADPPYALPSGELAATLDALVGAGLCVPGAVVVVERDRRSPWSWPASIEPLRERRYGETALWYGLAL